MLEVHGNIIAANVRSHCNNRCGVELPNQMTRGDTIKVWHDDIHQDQVVLRASIHLVDSFKTIELGPVSTGSASQSK
jgi:hypothetical protein